jgi:RNA-directed DNA polymerase
VYTPDEGSNRNCKESVALKRVVDEISQPNPSIRNLGQPGEATSVPERQEVTTSRHGLEEERALAETMNTMERICNPSNLREALTRVVENAGAGGVDRMSTLELSQWYEANEGKLIQTLLAGKYQPSPIRSVEIPKATGGARELGIPTVVDRLVQQAMHQVLQTIFEPIFSDYSYGFRPGRGAQDAISQASLYIKEGKEFVVDMDLEKFFDRVNHDILLSLVYRKMKDTRVLKLIGRFLKAGMMRDGVVVARAEGTPQGGPLSPLLSNIMLTELDRELESRGHSFCRYADDCNVYVESQRAAERVLESLTNWLSKRLRLQVNRSKSAAAPVGQRKFLGFRLRGNGEVVIAPESFKRFKQKVTKLTKRRNPVSLEDTIGRINSYTAGWLGYFGRAQCQTKIAELDSWIRRRLRATRLHQCKRKYTRYRFLHSLGVGGQSAWKLAVSGKGMWRLAKTHAAHQGMNNEWFKEQGYQDMVSRLVKLKQKRNRLVREVR